jgi:hypothetical protein
LNKIEAEYEFETTFEYVKYMMRKHIDNTIGRKEEKITGKGNNGPEKLNE